eukprot:Skav202389  [mRNA]  locus=scaffold1406:409279:411123:- [translate_table: standard]
MASQRVHAASSAPLPTGERVDEFFQRLEAEVVFPEEELASLTPEPLLQHWKDVGTTQSVAWPWVMLCELALASFLTPNARFQPLASFSVYSLTWSFFLHPGSCHTSNLLRLYHNVLHGLEDKVNAHRAAERQRLAAQAMPNPAAQRALKEQKKKLQPIMFRLGTGSLEGIGLRIAGFLGWTAAGGFMVEGTQFLQWLQTEFGVNKAIATQLWERMSWQRDVINLQRSFSMPYPCIGVCGALHLEDIWPLFAGPDPLGLRGRLCLFYTRPVMKRAREIADANNRLGNMRGTCKLEASLVDQYFPIYKAHSTDYRDEAAFHFHLGYPFLNYSFSDAEGGAAEAAFVLGFDKHVALQEENYLVNHEESKRHGKLKGKHLRHALNWLNLINCWTSAEFNAWPTGITKDALKAAELIGQHCEGVAAVIKAVSMAKDGAPRDAALPADVPRTQTSRLTALVAAPAATFLAGIVSHRAFILQFAAAILTMHTEWLESTRLRSHSQIRDALPAASQEEILVVVWNTMILISHLGLGMCGLSTNTTGPKKLFLVKRPLREEVWAHDVLTFFTVEPADYHAPSEVDMREKRPKQAPLLPFPEVQEDAVRACLETLGAWRPQGAN